MSAQIYEFGPFSLDTRERVLMRDGHPVSLKPKVYETLVALVTRSGHVVDKEELMQRVWPDVSVEENNLTGNIFALRRAFGDFDCIETVPRRGYRFTAQVKHLSIADFGSGIDVIITKSTIPQPHAINSLAVLPFINASADPNTEYLSDGVTESIINSLSQLPRLHVMARSTVFRYKGREVDIKDLGRELNVGAVLLGRVLLFGDQLIIRTELVEVSSGAQLWGEQYNRTPTDILAVQEEIATEISEKLRLKLTERERSILTRRYTEKTEAYQAYLKGRYFWEKRTEEALMKAVEYFQQAIDADQNYALAYAGLADCYAVLGNFSFVTPDESYPKAKTAAIKALEIDDALAEAHASLAWVKTHYDWDWPGAERKFKRAIELNPIYAPAHYWYALFLSAMGRHQEAIVEGRRAVEAEPLSVLPNWVLGWTLFFARQNEEAIEQLGETAEMEPNFVGRWVIAGAYGQMGMHEEAISELSEAIDGAGNRALSMAMLGHAYAAGGRRDEARAVLAELEKIGKQKYVAPFFIALIYVGLAEKEQALEWLERAYDCRSWGLIWLGVDPWFDSLRSEEGFTNLLLRIGLES